MPSDSTLHASRSAERVLDLLQHVGERAPTALTEAAEATGIPVSTALRHLRVLADRGWVERRTDGSYQLGPTATRLAPADTGGATRDRLVAVAEPHLRGLAMDTGESCYLAVRSGDEALYLSTAEGTRTIRHVGWVGRSVPIAGTAVGEALTANDREADPFSNVGAAESDVGAVTAPIWFGDHVVAAISILGPASRFDRDSIRVLSPLAHRTASTIESALHAAT